MQDRIKVVIGHNQQPFKKSLKYRIAVFWLRNHGKFRLLWLSRFSLKLFLRMEGFMEKVYNYADDTAFNEEWKAKSGKRILSDE